LIYKAQIFVTLLSRNWNQLVRELHGWQSLEKAVFEEKNVL